jgi:UDP-3-O-[3-hydroxymyristoyl] N-acetylglucosamine deacetylase
MQKRTIREEIELRGVGLHTGEEICLRILPDDRGLGINFLRADNGRGVWIPASVNGVKATSFATIIGVNGTRVSTVEHLMAAFYGLGIDSALVEVRGPEVPIMDGSAREFADAIEAVGARETEGIQKTLVIKRPIQVVEQDKSIVASPYPGLRIKYTIEFDHPLIGHQEMELELDQEAFLKLISPARTFGFLKDVEELKRAGYAKGGSLSNAVVLDHTGVLNPEGLRFQDEFVRHKILDFLGDLALLGRPVQGSFQVKKSGHTLNHMFLKELLSQRDCWELV